MKKLICAVLVVCFTLTSCELALAADEVRALLAPRAAHSRISETAPKLSLPITPLIRKALRSGHNPEEIKTRLVRWYFDQLLPKRRPSTLEEDVVSVVLDELIAGEDIDYETLLKRVRQRISKQQRQRAHYSGRGNGMLPQDAYRAIIEGYVNRLLEEFGNVETTELVELLELDRPSRLHFVAGFPLAKSINFLVWGTVTAVFVGILIPAMVVTRLLHFFTNPLKLLIRREEERPASAYWKKYSIFSKRDDEKFKDKFARLERSLGVWEKPYNFDVEEPQENQVERVEVLTAEGNCETVSIRFGKLLGAGQSRRVYECWIDGNEEEKFAVALYGRHHIGTSKKWSGAIIETQTILFRQSLPTLRHVRAGILQQHYANKIINTLYEAEHGDELTPEVSATGFRNNGEALQIFPYVEGVGLRPDKLKGINALIAFVKESVRTKRFFRNYGLHGPMRQADWLNLAGLGNLILDLTRGRIKLLDMIAGMPVFVAITAPGLFIILGVGLLLIPGDWIHTAGWISIVFGGVYMLPFLVSSEWRYGYESLSRGDFPAGGEVWDFDKLEKELRRNEGFLRQRLGDERVKELWHDIQLQQVIARRVDQSEPKLYASGKWGKRWRALLFDPEMKLSQRRQKLALLESRGVISHARAREYRMQLERIGTYPDRLLHEAIWWWPVCLAKAFLSWRGFKVLLADIGQWVLKLLSRVKTAIINWWPRVKKEFWRSWFILTRASYRTRLTRQIILSWIDDDEFNARINKEEAILLRKELENPQVVELLSLYIVYTSVSLAKSHIAETVGNPFIAIPLAFKGFYWPLLAMCFGGTFRFVFTFLLYRFRYPRALIISAIPKLGLGLGIPMELYRQHPELSKYMIKRLAGDVNDRIPGIGGKGNLTDVMAVGGAANTAIWLMKIINAIIWPFSWLWNVSLARLIRTKPKVKETKLRLPRRESAREAFRELYQELRGLEEEAEERRPLLEERRRKLQLIHQRCSLAPRSFSSRINIPEFPLSGRQRRELRQIYVEYQTLLGRWQDLEDFAREYLGLIVKERGDAEIAVQIPALAIAELYYLKKAHGFDIFNLIYKGRTRWHGADWQEVVHFAAARASVVNGIIVDNRLKIDRLGLTIERRSGRIDPDNLSHFLIKLYNLCQVICWNDYVRDRRGTKIDLLHEDVERDERPEVQDREERAYYLTIGFSHGRIPDSEDRQKYTHRKLDGMLSAAILDARAKVCLAELPEEAWRWWSQLELDALVLGIEGMRVLNWKNDEHAAIIRRVNRELAESGERITREKIISALRREDRRLVAEQRRQLAREAMPTFAKAARKLRNGVAAVSQRIARAADEAKEEGPESRTQRRFGTKAAERRGRGRGLGRKPEISLPIVAAEAPRGESRGDRRRRLISVINNGKKEIGNAVDALQVEFEKIRTKPKQWDEFRDHAEEATQDILGAVEKMAQVFQELEEMGIAEGDEDSYRQKIVDAKAKLDEVWSLRHEAENWFRHNLAREKKIDLAVVWLISACTTTIFPTIWFLGKAVFLGLTGIDVTHYITTVDSHLILVNLPIYKLIIMELFPLLLTLLMLSSMIIFHRIPILKLFASYDLADRFNNISSFIYSIGSAISSLPISLYNGLRDGKLIFGKFAYSAERTIRFDYPMSFSRWQEKLTQAGGILFNAFMVTLFIPANFILVMIADALSAKVFLSADVILFATKAHLWFLPIRMFAFSALLAIDCMLIWNLLSEANWFRKTRSLVRPPEPADQKETRLSALAVRAFRERDTGALRLKIEELKAKIEKLKKERHHHVYSMPKWEQQEWEEFLRSGVHGKKYQVIKDNQDRLAREIAELENRLSSLEDLLTQAEKEELRRRCKTADLTSREVRADILSRAAEVEDGRLIAARAILEKEGVSGFALFLLRPYSEDIIHDELAARIKSGLADGLIRLIKIVGPHYANIVVSEGIALDDDTYRAVYYIADGNEWKEFIHIRRASLEILARYPGNRARTAGLLSAICFDREEIPVLQERALALLADLDPEEASIVERVLADERGVVEPAPAALPEFKLEPQVVNAKSIRNVLLTYGLVMGILVFIKWFSGETSWGAEALLNGVSAGIIGFYVSIVSRNLGKAPYYRAKRFFSLSGPRWWTLGSFGQDAISGLIFTGYFMLMDRYFPAHIGWVAPTLRVLGGMFLGLGFLSPIYTAGPQAYFGRMVARKGHEEGVYTGQELTDYLQDYSSRQRLRNYLKFLAAVFAYFFVNSYIMHSIFGSEVFQQYIDGVDYRIIYGWGTGILAGIFASWMTVTPKENFDIKWFLRFGFVFSGLAIIYGLLSMAFPIPYHLGPGILPVAGLAFLINCWFSYRNKNNNLGVEPEKAVVTTAP